MESTGEEGTMYGWVANRTAYLQGLVQVLYGLLHATGSWVSEELLRNFVAEISGCDSRLPYRLWLLTTHTGNHLLLDAEGRLQGGDGRVDRLRTLLHLRQHDQVVSGLGHGYYIL